MSINKVVVTGNLTREPVLRATAGGTAVLQFGMAVNDRRRNKSGEWEDYANFVDCVMFGRRADAVKQYLYKGCKVAVEGRLHYSKWTDRDTGGMRSKIEVIVEEIEFMSRRDGEKSGRDAVKDNFGSAATYEEYTDVSAYNDEDIPF